MVRAGLDTCFIGDDSSYVNRKTHYVSHRVLATPPPIFQLRSSSLHPAWYPCIVTPAQKRNMRIIVETFIFCALKT